MTDARTAAKWFAIALVGMAALDGAGCGGDDGEDTESTTMSGATGVSGATGEGATAGAGAVPLDGPPDPALTVAEVAEAMQFPDAVVDDPGFKESLDILVAAGHKFWSETLSESGVPAQPRSSWATSTRISPRIGSASSRSSR